MVHVTVLILWVLVCYYQSTLNFDISIIPSIDNFLVLLGCSFNGKPRLVYIRMNKIRLSLDLLNQCPIYQRRRNKELATDEIMKKLEEYSVERRIEELQYDQNWGSSRAFTSNHFLRLRKATTNIVNYGKSEFSTSFLEKNLKTAYIKYKMDESKALTDRIFMSNPEDRCGRVDPDWLMDWPEFVATIGELDKLIDPIDLHLLEDYPYVDKKQSPIMIIDNNDFRISLKVIRLMKTTNHYLRILLIMCLRCLITFEKKSISMRNTRNICDPLKKTSTIRRNPQNYGKKIACILKHSLTCFTRVSMT